MNISFNGVQQVFRKGNCVDTKTTSPVNDTKLLEEISRIGEYRNCKVLHDPENNKLGLVTVNDDTDKINKSVLVSDAGDTLVFSTFKDGEEVRTTLNHAKFDKALKGDDTGLKVPGNFQGMVRDTASGVMYHIASRLHLTGDLKKQREELHEKATKTKYNQIQLWSMQF